MESLSKSLARRSAFEVGIAGQKFGKKLDQTAMLKAMSKRPGGININPTAPACARSRALQQR